MDHLNLLGQQTNNTTGDRASALSSFFCALDTSSRSSFVPPSPRARPPAQGQSIMILPNSVWGNPYPLRSQFSEQRYARRCSGTHTPVWSTSYAHLYGETHTQSRPVFGVAMCAMLSVAKRHLRSATVVHVCSGLPRMGFPIPSHSELLHT
mgnify:FL=1